ncbi:hypothetical protein [Planosporangium mesophilum]|nr:hypothetical protein [Planosporangium mesophilum]NJC82407.1 hypothetical protein [Planosporangium mesophilum]
MPTLLADVRQLRTALRAMDRWEAAGGDLTSAHDRRRFVDDLDGDAAYELSGLALTRLGRLVFAEKARTAETCTPGDDSYPAAPAIVGMPRQGHRRVAASLSFTP